MQRERCSRVREVTHWTMPSHLQGEEKCQIHLGEARWLGRDWWQRWCLYCSCSTHSWLRGYNSNSLILLWWIEGEVLIYAVFMLHQGRQIRRFTGYWRGKSQPDSGVLWSFVMVVIILHNRSKFCVVFSLKCIKTSVPGCFAAYRTYFEVLKRKRHCCFFSNLAFTATLFRILDKSSTVY